LRLDGVWATELLGLLGWERTGITFFDDGNIRGGGADFYHYGTYVVDGQKVKMTLHFTSHGNHKKVYGENRKKFSVRIKGKRNGDKIQGKGYLVGARSDDVAHSFRLLKLDDSPSAS